MPQCLFSMTCKYSTIKIILTILISKKATNLQINITILSGNLGNVYKSSAYNNNSNKSTYTCKTLNIKVNKEPGLDC